MLKSTMKGFALKLRIDTLAEQVEYTHESEKHNKVTLLGLCACGERVTITLFGPAADQAFVKGAARVVLILVFILVLCCRRSGIFLVVGVVDVVFVLMSVSVDACVSRS